MLRTHSLHNTRYLQIQLDRWHFLVHNGTLGIFCVDTSSVWCASMGKSLRALNFHVIFSINLSIILHLQRRIRDYWWFKFVKSITWNLKVNAPITFIIRPVLKLYMLLNQIFPPICQCDMNKFRITFMDASCKEKQVVNNIYATLKGIQRIGYRKTC